MAMLKSIMKTAMNNKGNIFNGGLGLYFGASTFQEAKEAGDGTVSAGLQAAGEFALPYLLGGWGYLGYSLLTEAPSMVMEGIHAYDQKAMSVGQEFRNAGRAFSDSHFNDSEQAFTMRQAGMEIAKRSRYNIQQAMLGNEAKYMMK